MRRVVCTLVATMVMSAVMLSRAQMQRESKVAPFWNELKPGPYPVGFRVVYYRDRSRKWLKTLGASAPDPGRPIRVSVWYPALPSATNARMRGR